jgi:hypothetical protein
MYNSFGELPGFTAVKQNGLHVGVEDSHFSVVPYALDTRETFHVGKTDEATLVSYSGIIAERKSDNPPSRFLSKVFSPNHSSILRWSVHKDAVGLMILLFYSFIPSLLHAVPLLSYVIFM